MDIYIKNVKLVVSMNSFLYAIFLTYILLGFFAELIFTNMSITLQYMFFALLPFLLGSKNIDTITYKIKNK